MVLLYCLLYAWFIDVPIYKSTDAYKKEHKEVILAIWV